MTKRLARGCAALFILALPACPAQPRPDPCAERFGCLVIEPGEPIVLGTLLVTKGEHATLGIDSRNGVEVAVAERPALYGHPIELIHRNERCSEEGGRAGASDLVHELNLVAVIGTSCTSAALPAAGILGAEGILLVSPSDSGPAMTDPETHPPFYARTAHNDRAQGIAVAEYAAGSEPHTEELNARTAVTISDGSAYAEGLGESFSARFTALGGSVAQRLRIRVGATEADAEILLREADSPDVIYFPIFVKEGAAVIRAARKLPALADTQLIASDGLFTAGAFFTRKLFDLTGIDAAVGLHISGPDLTSFTGGDRYKQFLHAYEERFGEEPQAVFHALAYDASNIVLDALTRSAIRKRDGTLLVPRVGLRDSLLATRRHPGLSGMITCDHNGDCAAPMPMCVFTVYEEPVDSSGWCYPEDA